MWRMVVGSLPALAVLLALVAWVPLGGRMTATPTPMPTATATPSPSATPTATATQTPTATATPSPRATATPSATPTPSPTFTATPARTATPVARSAPPRGAVFVPVAAGPGAIPLRIRAPRAGIDAGVVRLDLNADGSMQAPDGPDPVGWYVFSPKLGAPGNGLYSGHVDWRTGVTGVFWRLRELAKGDKIYLTGDDGQEYVYAVTSSTLYRDADAPLMEIIGPKPGEVITLITCEGEFDPVARNYDKRRVVVAERVP